MGDLPNLRLGHCAQRCKRAAQLRLTQTEKKIGLILARIDAFAKHGVCSRGALAAIGDEGVADLPCSIIA